MTDFQQQLRELAADFEQRAERVATDYAGEARANAYVDCALALRALLPDQPEPVSSQSLAEQSQRGES